MPDPTMMHQLAAHGTRVWHTVNLKGRSIWARLLVELRRHEALQTFLWRLLDLRLRAARPMCCVGQQYPPNGNKFSLRTYISATAGTSVCALFDRLSHLSLGPHGPSQLERPSPKRPPSYDPARAPGRAPADAPRTAACAPPPAAAPSSPPSCTCTPCTICMGIDTCENQSSKLTVQGVWRHAKNAGLAVRSELDHVEVV